MSTQAAAPAVIPQKRWAYVIPVAVVMYMLAYLDRNNVAVILPYINQQDPHMAISPSSQGLISGIFFVGYMCLQVPGAVLAQKWSAKRVVVILMCCWGVVAMLCGAVQDKPQFLIVRFILGVFEGGVWPAVLVLLASWFPLKERARANALWMCCLPLSSVIMAPISGALLSSLSWRWVFVIEGIPPLVWGIVWWFVISDRPPQAKWVSTAERDYIMTELAAEEAAKPASEAKGGYQRALKDSRSWLLILIYFCWMTGFYGFSMWLPTVLKELTGGDSTKVGWLTAIPYAFALVGMILVSRWSDAHNDRKHAVAIPVFVGAVALVIGQLVHVPGVEIVLLCVAAVGIYAPYGPFWAIPAGFLRITVLAFTMGLINALGNLGGFVGPYIVGWLKSITGGHDIAGFVFLAVMLVAAGVVTLATIKPLQTDDTPTPAPVEA
ncbi:MAG: MFS transporter [Propionibacteriaceae bacterium]|nr:MFS transporter [Propionibacteriaceae bacterium]